MTSENRRSRTLNIVVVTIATLAVAVIALMTVHAFTTRVPSTTPSPTMSSMSGRR